MKKFFFCLFVLIGVVQGILATEYITDVMIIADQNKSTYTAQGWTVIDYDLNKGAGGKFIYLLYKTNNSPGSSGTAITDIYLKTGNSSRPNSLTHDGRTYYSAPSAGANDLNSGAGGAFIFLYYTKDDFTPGRAISNIYFNSSSSGAVGANGNNSSGFDLNSGARGEYIYMHLNTVPTGQYTDVYNEEQLRAAFILNGAYIRMMDNINISSEVEVNANRTITLDLNGKTLNRGLSSATNYGHVLKVISGSTLSINDASGNNSGIIKGGYTSNGGAINNYGTLIINGGTIRDNQSDGQGGGIINRNNGTLVINGGVISNNQSNDGAGIYNEGGGSIYMYGGSIQDNTAFRSGFVGGIANHGSLTVKGGSIRNNIGNNGGGVWSNGTFVLTGGTIEGNVSGFGAGLYLNSGTATITGGTIIGNDGHGVYFTDGTLNMEGNPVISGNYDSQESENLFMATSSRKITVSGPFTSGANIGIRYASDAGIFTSGFVAHNPSLSPNSVFTSDTGDNIALYNDEAICSPPTGYITDVALIGGSKDETIYLKSIYEPQGWTIVDYDLNLSVGGYYIYLMYKTDKSPGSSKTPITDFNVYLKNPGDSQPKTYTYGGRTYYKTNGGGNDEFIRRGCDLNHDADGVPIHLYYTKDSFDDHRAVTGIVFNGSSGGAVKFKQKNEAANFNEGRRGVGISAIFMHLVTRPYITPHVVWCSDDQTLYFVSGVPGSVVIPGHSADALSVRASSTNVVNVVNLTPDWTYGPSGTCKRVVFDKSFANVRPKSLNMWFADLASLTKIEGLENLNTSEVTEMKETFKNCSSLTNIDVNSFNVSKVTSALSMFQNCTSLTTIYCDNTWNISGSERMFSNCPSLVGAVSYNDNNNYGTSMANPVTGYFTAKATLASDADNSSTLQNLNGYCADVTLDGLTLHKDGAWNALCLPFSLTDYQLTTSPLAGATLKKLGESTSFLDTSTGTLTLTLVDADAIEAGQPYLVRWGSDAITIGSTAEWDAFAANVNNGTESCDGKRVLLTADINVTTMVGTKANPFRGFFDGQGHTLNVSIADTGNYGTAPFRYISGASIQNVKVTGTVNGTSHCAGLVGYAWSGTNVISNCEVAASIVCSGGYCGGILGHGKSTTTTIANCLFSGSISGATQKTGIIYGWGDTGRHTILNCLANGTYTDCAGIDLIAGGNTKTVTNCYKTQTDGSYGTYTTATGSDLVALLGSSWEVNNGSVVPSNATDVTSPVFRKVILSANAPTTIVSPDNKVRFTGTYAPLNHSGGDNTKLFLNDNNTFYTPEDVTNLSAFRAYVQLNGITAGEQADVRNVVISLGDSNDPMKKPTELAVSDVQPYSAVLSWTENSLPPAVAWVVAYKTGSDEFTEVNADSNPFTLTDLIDNTEYTVKVRPANSQNYIKWSDEMTFTTPSDDVVPTDLAATDITTTTATLSWDSYQENTNVRYKKANKPIWAEDFKNGIPTDWTVYTLGDVVSNQTQGWYSWDLGDQLLGEESDNIVACSRSWDAHSETTELHADNWLVSPQLDLQGMLRFHIVVDPIFPDKYEVKLSLAGNSLEDFTSPSAITLREMAPASNEHYLEPDEVAIDLSAYAGQQGYIAIHHQDYDAFFILIDDFGIYRASTAEDEWTTVAANGNTLSLTGLEDGSKYEWQVQGVKASGTTEWSNMSSFTTLAYLQLADNDTQQPIGEKNTDLIAKNDGKKTDVRLQGRTLYLDGDWNTICLPFNMTADQLAASPLNKANLMELDGDYSEFDAMSGTLTLNFTDATTIAAGKPYLVRWKNPLTVTGGTAGMNEERASLRYLTDGIIDPGDNSIKKWCARNNSQTWSAEFSTAAPISVTNYTITTGNDTYPNYLNRNPTRWTLKAKLNADDEWSLIDSRDANTNSADALPAANFTAKNYDILPAFSGEAYQYFRLDITQNGGGEGNNGYIIQLSEFSINGEMQDPVFTGVTIDGASPAAVSSSDEKVSFTGTYASMSFGAEDKSLLFLGGGNTLYYPEAGASINAQRAYFQLNGITSGTLSGVRALLLNFDDSEPSEITTTDFKDYMDKADTWYSLDGRKLDGKPTRAGLFIVNGKKVIVK